MGLMDEIQKLDAQFMLDPDLCPGAESVLYRPRSGAPRTINAVVDRLTPTDMFVTVRNDATAGITADEAERFGGGDTVTLPVRAGSSTGTTLTLFVPTLEETGGRPWHDAGMCTFRLGQKHQGK